MTAMRTNEKAITRGAPFSERLFIIYAIIYALFQREFLMEFTAFVTPADSELQEDLKPDRSL